MFTGIIEALGKVERIENEGTNIHFTLKNPFVGELKIDQSIAHDGCCLTVDKLEEMTYRVTAIQETLEKTNLSKWAVGTEVNLERCTVVGGRLDGHIVQGHIDQVGRVKSIQNLEGSHLITIEYKENLNFTTVEQGSISLNGISLTVARNAQNEFSVAIIPYTWENTNLRNLNVGDEVNLEFDIIGKYVAKLIRNANENHH